MTYRTRWRMDRHGVIVTIRRQHGYHTLVAPVNGAFLKCARRKWGMTSQAFLSRVSKKGSRSWVFRRYEPTPAEPYEPYYHLYSRASKSYHTLGRGLEFDILWQIWEHDPNDLTDSH